MSRLLEFFKRVAREKREYRQKQERVNSLPEDYRYVYNKIQHYMWSGYAGVDGMDTIPILTDLLDLFETGAVEGKHVLDVTGEDVAGFCDELLRNTRTWTGNRREELNNDILNKLGKGD